MTGIFERLRLERELGLLREAETQCIAPAGSTRRSVADTTATPYRWVCLIETKTDRESFPEFATGILVSPRHVLTAGHAVYRKGARYEKVVAKPGARASWSAGEYSSRNRYVLTAYRTGQRSANDLGLIELTRDVVFKSKSALNLRYFGDPGPRRLAYAMGLYPAASILGLPPGLNAAALRNRPVTSVGYPGDRRRSFDAMFEVNGWIRSLDIGRGIADLVLDACTGQSGSPVFLAHNKDNYLIGLTASIHPRESLASVALLTAPRVKALHAGILSPEFTGPLPARDDG